MRLNDEIPNIETSGELEEQFFSIKDQGMIFDILRNKMYSNPILAICREISCNARDAHREVGTPEVPVEIHLPNTLEPFYKIKDFGPGISTDRMSNIFIQYTASTKREDNLQTGGFGLGAKTPFSYSDTFTIITNVDGTQYNYACFIDETKVGKLVLFSSSPTKEPNGTEIIIPVKLADIKNFTQWTEQATRHWDVKPIIKGGSISYPEISKVIDGDKWSIATVANSWHREIKLIIDGIEYPLELSALRTYANSNMIDSARGSIYLYFDVGELSLSASREQVYLDKKTQFKIKSKLDKMEAEIKTRVINKIQSFDNLWLANVYYRKELNNAFNRISFLGKLSWHGLLLSDYSSLDVKCPVYCFTKGKHGKYGTDPNKISKHTGNHSIIFDENFELFINDLIIKEPTGRHVKQAFETNPNLKSIQVICPTDEITEDVLNDLYNLDSMKPRMLSEITKASTKKYTIPTSRLIVFRVDPINFNFRQVSFSVIDEDTNTKVLCKVSKDSYPYSNGHRWAILKNGKILTNASFNTLIRAFPEVSFYGLDSTAPQDRIDSDFANFIDLETFLKSKVIATAGINFVEIKFAQLYLYKIDDRQLKYLSQFKKLVANADSLFLKRLDMHDKIKKISRTDHGLLEIYETVNECITNQDVEDFLKNNPDYDIDALEIKYLDKYFLIKYLNTYKYGELIEDLSKYINFVDSE